jgi:large subunit ribosomal protein L32e
MRKQYSGVPALVKVGYRGPKVARGLHPSGYNDCLVFNEKDLLLLNPSTDAARLSHTIGGRKRIQIIAKASEIGIKILNAGKSSSASQKKNTNASSSDQANEGSEDH